MPTQFGYINKELGATETTETDLGEITVPEKANRVTGICAAVVLETGTAAEGTLAHARLSYSGSGEIDGVPCAIVVSEELGGSYTPEFMPINLPVTALSKIKCYATLTLDQTGTAHALISLRFE